MTHILLFLILVAILAPGLIYAAGFALVMGTSLILYGLAYALLIALLIAVGLWIVWSAVTNPISEGSAALFLIAAVGVSPYAKSLLLLLRRRLGLGTGS